MEKYDEMITKDKPQCGNIRLLHEYGNKEDMMEARKNWNSADCTKGIVEIYDVSTGMYSEKYLHKSSKGYYFTKHGKRYYLHDFK